MSTSEIVLGKNNKVFRTYRGCGMDVLICRNLSSSAPPCEATTLWPATAMAAPRVHSNHALQAP